MSNDQQPSQKQQLTELIAKLDVIISDLFLYKDRPIATQQIVERALTYLKQPILHQAGISPETTKLSDAFTLSILFTKALTHFTEWDTFLRQELERTGLNFNPRLRNTSYYDVGDTYLGLIFGFLTERQKHLT